MDELAKHGAFDEGHHDVVSLFLIKDVVSPAKCWVVQVLEHLELHGQLRWCQLLIVVQHVEAVDLYHVVRIVPPLSEKDLRSGAAK